MGIILQGPVNLQVVTNLIEGVCEAFGRQNPFGWSSYGIRIHTKIINPQNVLTRIISSEECEKYSLQLNGISRLRWEEKVNPLELASRVEVYSKEHNGYSNDHLATTEILEVSALEDIISGQVIPNPIKKFYISSDEGREGRQRFGGSFNKFLAYRNRLIQEAQQRLNASVSKAAYNIMTDLHP